MSPNNTPASSFIGRVLSNDSTKRGLASAVVGVLVAIASEALFPAS